MEKVTESHGILKLSKITNPVITHSKISFKIMTAHNTLKYLDALTELLDRCNLCIHSGINMAPADRNHYNDEVVW